MTLAQFEKTSGDFASRGYRIAHIDGTATLSGPRYAAVWERGEAGGWQSFAALTGPEYMDKRAALAALGFQPRHISGYSDGGRSYFAATFEKSSAPYEAHHQMTHALFREKYRTKPEDGYRLTDVSAHLLNGNPVYSGVWEKA
jgi:hypothetical protein